MTRIVMRSADTPASECAGEGLPLQGTTTATILVRLSPVPDPSSVGPLVPLGGRRADDAAFRRLGASGRALTWVMAARGQVGLALGRALARPPGRMIDSGPSGYDGRRFP